MQCSLQPSPPGCFTKKLSEARGNGIGFVAAGEGLAAVGANVRKLALLWLCLSVSPSRFFAYHDE